MKSTTWRPCWNNPSIWRMFHVRPDREILITVDLPRAKLLTFELEWDDLEGRRHYVAWGPKKGLEIGVVDLDLRVPAATSPDAQMLGSARRIVEGAGLENPMSDWILDRLPA
jgi:hypothetical protein